MNTDQIAYLIDIAKTGSINTTAKRMFSSQQAVSEAIKRLEQELNCTILNRTKRGVSLTEDGKYVLNHVSPMMEQYQTLQQHFKNTNEPSGILHIGIAQFMTSIVLADLIFEMYRQYPNITLFTQEMNAEEIIEAVYLGKIDLGIACFSNDFLPLQSVMEQYNGIMKFYPLYVDPIVCVMHQNNPFSSEEIIHTSHLPHMKFTSYNFYIQAENMPPALHISNNSAIHKKFMKEENTVCFLNYQAYKTLFSEKEFVALPVENSSPVTMCLFHGRKEKDTYQNFIKIATEITRQL